MKLLEWYLVSFVFFLLLTLARFFFRAEGLNSQPIGMAVLAGLIVTLLVQAGTAIGQHCWQERSAAIRVSKRH